LSASGEGEPRTTVPASTPIESDYYTQKLVRVEGQWLIESLQVRHNLPMAF
jgi:hypothetical protein